MLVLHQQPCGDDVDCWDAFRWNLSRRKIVQSSPVATYVTSRHSYHTTWQRRFGRATLIGYVPLKYLALLTSHSQFSVVWAVHLLIIRYELL